VVRARDHVVGGQDGERLPARQAPAGGHGAAEARRAGLVHEAEIEAAGDRGGLAQPDEPVEVAALQERALQRGRGLEVRAQRGLVGRDDDRGAAEAPALDLVHRVVSDRVGCTADLVVAGENGVVVPEGCAGALSAALHDLVTNCRGAGAGGRARGRSWRRTTSA
jgi:hypothetical protein